MQPNCSYYFSSFTKCSNKKRVATQNLTQIHLNNTQSLFQIKNNRIQSFFVYETYYIKWTAVKLFKIPYIDPDYIIFKTKYKRMEIKSQQLVRCVYLFILFSYTLRKMYIVCYISFQMHKILQYLYEIVNLYCDPKNTCFLK